MSGFDLTGDAFEPDAPTTVKPTVSTGEPAIASDEARLAREVQRALEIGEPVTVVRPGPVTVTRPGPMMNPTPDITA